MEKFIPFEKLSKSEQRKRNAARRGSWHGLNPVTRRQENLKAYNRQKARKWSDDSMTVPFDFVEFRRREQNGLEQNGISPMLPVTLKLFGEARHST